MAFPVSVIQTTVDAGDVDTNRRLVVHLIAEAAAKGARLIVLPEACITDIYRGAEVKAESIPGPTTELIAQAAGDAVVAAGLLERAADGNVYSSCALIARDGVRGIARKCHLYRDASGHDAFRDAEIMQPGSELSIIDLNDARVGVLIGFDADFPEAYRALALRGADFIAVALNQIALDLHFLSAMAARNRIALLVANRIGFRRIYPGVPEFSAMAMSLVQDKDGTFLARCRGGSVIFDSGGGVLAEPSQNLQRDLESIAGAPPAAIIPLAHFQQDEVMSASFRIDELRVQRLSSPYIAARRPELYGVVRASVPADEGVRGQGPGVSTEVAAAASAQPAPALVVERSAAVSLPVAPPQPPAEPPIAATPEPKPKTPRKRTPKPKIVNEAKPDAEPKRKAAPRRKAAK